MIRYTTPTLPLQLDGIDLSSDCDVYVTIKQEFTGKTINKSGDDLTILYDSDDDQTTISVTLTQEETAFLIVGERPNIQVNWIFAGGTRGASEIKRISIKENLLDEVIAYGD